LPLVAIYPIEGTFWSDHPYTVLDADWVGPEERDAADVFLKFLKDAPQQARAMALGFRPANTAVAIGDPLSPTYGVDPKQPETLLDVPDGAPLAKLLEIWEKTKRSSDVELVFDKSGSMNGDPMAQAKAGAKAFLESLGDRDEVSLMFFDSAIYPATPPKR